ncbi:DUF445 domain-containing protein [Roseococcus sp. MDT2-1-1]|uniref:DUF445 domain-containing protein n=2 Tax=Sabulicella glaciei TaxID=2984948 RepID=A0ABT3NXM0_9PROT|nr:DUF445 domain-containing protein [Roseococcus sp. MDT2-1-1]
MNAQDEALRAALARHRAFATFLLLLMGALMVLGYALPPSLGADLLAASAKAGVIGGLADWFAVTALFRRPLGLPIPHTAIIPRQKERLGQGLGRFVANHVFTESEVARVIARLDVAGIVGNFLADRQASRPAAEALAAALPRLLQTLEDGRARRMLTRLLPRVAGGPGGAQVVARALRALLAGGRHQAVLDLALDRLKLILAERQDSLRDAIKTRVRESGGALVGWAAGAYVANRVLDAVNTELVKMEPGDSSLRQAFEAWLESEIERLENEPQRAAALGNAMRQALAHPAVAEWLNDVWNRLRDALAADAANPNGRSVAVIEGALANAGRFLAEDENARAKLNAAVERTLNTLLPSAQTRLAEFIAGVVKSWDTAEVTEKIELRVGRDLQYVRMNGTIVGFLAGGVLYLLIYALVGRVSH